MRNPRVLCNIHGNSPSGLRPRARACIFHKTLGLMLYLPVLQMQLHDKCNYIVYMLLCQALPYFELCWLSISLTRLGGI